MKVFKFPDVNNEKWDGSGLKKKHHQKLAAVIRHEEKVKAAFRVMEHLEERLDAIETVRLRVTKDLAKAKQDYFRTLTETES